MRSCDTNPRLHAAEPEGCLLDGGFCVPRAHGDRVDTRDADARSRLKDAMANKSDF